MGVTELHSVHDAVARGMVFTPNHIETLLGMRNTIALEGNLPGGGTAGLRFLGKASPASASIGVATTVPASHRCLSLRATALEILDLRGQSNNLLSGRIERFPLPEGTQALVGGLEGRDDLGQRTPTQVPLLLLAADLEHEILLLVTANLGKQHGYMSLS